MIPDRFGTFDGKEFGESAGRERDHPYGGLSGFPAIIAQVTLQGFMGFRPHDPGPSGFGLGTNDAYVTNVTNLPRLYRKANHVEISDFVYFPPMGGPGVTLGTRELAWQFDRVAFQSGLPSATEEAVSGSWTPAMVIAASGPSVAQFVQTETVRNMGNVKTPPPAYSIDCITTVSKPIDVAPWMALLRNKLNAVTQFPGSYVLQLKSGISTAPEENPSENSDDYELVKAGFQDQTRNFASTTMGRGFGISNGPTFWAATESTTRLLFNVIVGSITLTMVKVLVRTIDNTTGVGLLTFAEWVVGTYAAGNRSELSCMRIPAVEVLDAPAAGIDNFGFAPEKLTELLRFAFPVTPIPPPAQVGNLVPTCSPNYQ